MDNIRKNRTRWDGWDWVGLGSGQTQTTKGLLVLAFLSIQGSILAYLLKTQLFNFLGNMGYMSVKD